MSSTFLYIILAILVFEYILERILAYLNSTYWSDHLPKELIGIYDEEKYKKSMAYEKQKQKFGLVVNTLTFLAMLVVLTLGGFGWLDHFIMNYTENPFLMALLFLVCWGWSHRSFPYLLSSTMYLFLKRNSASIVRHRKPSFLIKSKD